MGLDNRLWLGSSDNETKSPFSCCGVIRCRVNNQRSETPENAEVCQSVRRVDNGCLQPLDARPLIEVKNALYGHLVIYLQPLDLVARKDSSSCLALLAR